MNNKQSKNIIITMLGAIIGLLMIAAAPAAQAQMIGGIEYSHLAPEYFGPMNVQTSAYYAVPTVDNVSVYNTPQVPTVIGSLAREITGSNTGQNNTISSTGTTTTRSFNVNRTSSSNSASVIAATTVTDNGLSIDIENGIDTLTIGETVTYVVTIANTTDEVIKDIDIAVDLPSVVDFKHTSFGGFHQQNNTVLANLNSLEADDEFDFNVTAVVNTITSQDFSATTVAAATVDNITVETFDIDQVSNNDGTALTASVNNAGFWPTTLGGWLLIVLLVITLTAIVRTYRRNKARQQASLVAATA